MQKEAKARIKINNLLREAGWRFFDDENSKANILLENNVKLSKTGLNEFGEDFEKTTNGFVDFTLLDEKGFPLIVLEAKSEKYSPLVGKEKARKYAKSLNARFVILSNGNLHYFWDLQRGNPYIITTFPTPNSVSGYKAYQPNPQKLIDEIIEPDFIVLTQKPDYTQHPEWLDPAKRDEFIKINRLKFLRKYQIRAVQSIQNAVKEGNDRFLFEMATGTGKTLVAAAVIKLFLRTANARRVLFLVDRLELEDQAQKHFINYLKNDYKTVIYKENRDDWQKAEIVVATVQSLLFNNKYKQLFSPTDFDLVISDEAHRSIGGNSRAVFEYFVGYKLGLTATPKDYLKNYEPGKINEKDPRAYERRLLLDTYKTFGCESGQPTFRYSLLDGVSDNFLRNPIVVDARTEITTQLLSDEGYSVLVQTETGEEQEQFFFYKDFEKKFFSEETNRVFCQTFLENSLRDPINGEIGKSIVFCVSQDHAEKITRILNEIADRLFPGKYQSDFAVQVTSRIDGAQEHTISFANNNLNGQSNFLPGYRTGKTRVCVTVGMMTTGYDCEDILNLALLRPIFSPTDFIQIKGRGTRTFTFEFQRKNRLDETEVIKVEKQRFKLFDFFANCEYFEEKFNYDEVLELPLRQGAPGDGGGTYVRYQAVESSDPDRLASLEQQAIGYQGMKIDRMFFKFEEEIKEDDFVKENIAKENWEAVIEYIQNRVFNQPEAYYTLEKLRKSAAVDRRLSLREILEKIFGKISDFKSKDELLEEEFEKFLSIYKPEDADIPALKYYFKAYITDPGLREIIAKKQFGQLNYHPRLGMSDFKAVAKKWRELIPEYVKDYVPLNAYMV